MGLIQAPWYQLRSPALDGAGGPIDPLTVSGIVRYMSYKSPNPLKRDLTAAANLDLVVFCNDQYQPGGGTRQDRTSNIDDPTESPIMRTGTASDGLQFDILGIQSLLINNNAEMQAGLTVFTAYAWGDQVDNNTGWFPIANNASGTGIFVASNVLTFFDDTFNGATLSGVSGGKVLIRVSVDAMGNCVLSATGAGTDSSGAGFGTCTFDLVGLSGIWGNNGDIGNRILGCMIFDSLITLDSPTDLGLRATIATFGAYDL